MEVGRSARGTTNAAGRVELAIAGPHQPGTRWELRTLVITSERVGDGSYPTASLYRSIVSTAYLLGTSRAADRVTFDGTGDWLLPGDQLLIVVEGAAPSTTAAASLAAVQT